MPILFGMEQHIHIYIYHKINIYIYSLHTQTMAIRPGGMREALTIIIIIIMPLPYQRVPLGNGNLEASNTTATYVQRPAWLGCDLAVLSIYDRRLEDLY